MSVNELSGSSVSVIIPAYNCENTVSRAVDSILSGSILPMEILLYDDFSNDNTAKTLGALAEKYTRVKAYFGNENRGAGEARQFLIDKASGDYFAFMDADDWWYEAKLEKQLQKIQIGNFDIVTCGYDIYSSTGELLSHRIPPRNINYCSMHFANFLPMSMTVVRSSLVGVKDMPSLRKRQDYAYWLNIYKVNKGLRTFVIKDRLGGYSKMENSLSSSRLNNVIGNYNMFRFLNFNMISSVFFVMLNIFFRILKS